MTKSNFKFSLFAATMMAGTVALTSGQAHATNGYFSHGYGTALKGMAGAGVAMAEDAISAATNPASMVHIGNRFDIGVSAFMPDRDITSDGGTVGNGTATGVAGKFKSKNELFFVPEFGVNKMIDANSSIGFTMNANGGMNTEYPGPDPFGNFGAGVTNPTGVDLSQALAGVTYARKIGKHSYGVTPTIAAQRFKAYGLAAFQGISSNAAFVTGNGYDWSYGYGVRLGYQGVVSDSLTIGVAYQSRMFMERFEKYKGLFADGGSFDIPQTLTIGAAYKLDNIPVTLAIDYQYIGYGSVEAINNEGNAALSTCSGHKALGASNGCGFGWDDQHIIKVGAKWQAQDDLVVRAGASHNTQPYGSDEILFNIIAPAVVQTHLSVGASYDVAPKHTISMAYTRALDESFTGTHPSNGTGNVTHRMDQHDLNIGYTYKW